MANTAPAREDVEALSALTRIILDAAAITKFLAHRWNLPAITDSLVSPPSPRSPPPALPKVLHSDLFYVNHKKHLQSLLSQDVTPYGPDAHQQQQPPRQSSSTTNKVRDLV